MSFNVDKRPFAAQLSLLHRCTGSISRILRRRGSPLLVAKILVVCKHLHKALSQNETSPPFLKRLHSQLISLRLALIKRIDKRLASANSTPDDIIEALAAHCLVTNSSSDDAVAHFHKLRLEAIGKELDTTDLTGENALKALRLFIRTLQTSRIILSRRLSDTLAKLKTRPLLSDPEVCNQDGLGIDVLGRWVAPNIINFTPWIKLGELSKPETEKIIKQWSTQAFDAFVKGCQGSLTNWSDFADLLSLRKRTLDTWLEAWNSTPAHSSLGVLEGIRTVFNEQLTRILVEQAKKLESFGQATSSTISDWESKDHINVQPLWDQGLISMDYSNGGANFKEAVVDRLLGRNEDISVVSKDYQTWRLSIEESRELVEEMRRARWIDILEESEEDLDIDITAMLNDDDPRLLSDSLQQAVRDSFESLQTSFGNTFSSFGPSNQSAKAAFTLRLIRQVRREIPSVFISPDFAFSSDIVPKLQELLVTEVSSHTGQLVFHTDPNSKLPGRTLWEGDPGLPVQPSPLTFKFLRRLMNSMDDCGPDLWDPSTVQVLKETLQENVSTSASTALENLNSPATTNKDTSPTEEQTSKESEPADSTSHTETTEAQSNHDDPNNDTNTRDYKIQLYFDTAYLNNALTSNPKSHDPNQNQNKYQLADTLNRIRETLESTSEETSRLEKAAADYWGRTKLLFGLLGDSE